MSARDLGLLALRLGVGGSLAAHGAQKLFGWFEGGGPEATGAMMGAMGFPGKGKTNALVAGAVEFGGGAALVLGLGTGPAGAALAGNMVVASSVHAPQGFFAQKGGYELPATLALVGTALSLTGAGRYSVDQLTGGVLTKRWMSTLGLVSAVAAAAYMITNRRPPEPPAEQADEAQAAEGGGTA